MTGYRVLPSGECGVTVEPVPGEWNPMTDIGRELLRLLTDRRSEWVYKDEWIDLNAPRIGLRAYGDSITLFVDDIERGEVLTREDILALIPVAATLTDELRASTRTNELRDVRRALGLPQGGE